MLFKRLTAGFANKNQPFWAIRLPLAILMIVSLVVSGLLGNATGSVRGENAIPSAMVDELATSIESFYNVEAKSPPLEESHLVTGAGGASGMADARHPRRHTGSAAYRVASLEFDSSRACNRFKIRGSYVFNRYDRFADIFIPDDGNAKQVIESISRVPGLVWFEEAETVAVPPPPAIRPTFKTRQPPEPIVRGGIRDLTGKGVTIAFVDTGLDFRNVDFVKYDSMGQPISRLLAFYDTTSNAFAALKLGTKPPFSYPDGTPLGTLYTREQLTSELRSLTPRIPATDLNGHGTGAAGVGAGNGNNAPENKFAKGVAPDADIIAVRIGSGAGDELENAYLLNAIVGWLDKIARDTPLVVSCSFGGHAGGHDGKRVTERQLDARFTSERSGRALVISGGNDGTSPIHAEVNFRDKNAAGVVRFTADPTGADIAIYFDSSKIEDLLVTNVSGLKKIAWLNPLTNQVAMLLKVSGGSGQLQLFNRSGRAMKADAYIFKGTFNPSIRTFEKLISSPGTTENAITVSSYDWNSSFGGVDRLDFCGNPITVGGLSCYSSPGYTRMGTVKPDLAAPGEYYSASYARLPDGTGVNKDKIQVDATGKYRLFNGTSAATPYAAGVIALLMQAKPTLTLREIKKAVHDYASHSERLTGDVPNPKWGYGKLDLVAIEKMIRSVSGHDTR